MRRLTDNIGYDGDPSWSPDGTRIAFTSNGEIHAMNADGSGITRLTVDPASECCASWSPDGSRLVFVSGRGRNFNIWVMNSDGSQEEMLNRTLVYDGDPSWSRQ